MRISWGKSWTFRASFRLRGLQSGRPGTNPFEPDSRPSYTLSDVVMSYYYIKIFVFVATRLHGATLFNGPFPRHPSHPDEHRLGRVAEKANPSALFRIRIVFMLYFYFILF